jgi:hypothetical protein
MDQKRTVELRSVSRWTHLSTAYGHDMNPKKYQLIVDILPPQWHENSLKKQLSKILFPP